MLCSNDCGAIFISDIDECDEPVCGGNATCVNTFGGFQCECDLGFRHDDEDFHSCIGITGSVRLCSKRQNKNKYFCLNTTVLVPI